MEPSHVNGRVSWTDLVAQKKRQQCDGIPANWQLSGNLLGLAVSNPRLLEADVPRRSGIMSNAELDITENYSASQLLRELSTKKLDSVTVTTAFCKRAAIAQQMVSHRRVWTRECVLTIADFVLDRNFFSPGIGAGKVSRRVSRKRGQGCRPSSRPACQYQGQLLRQGRPVNHWLCIVFGAPSFTLQLCLG